MDVLNIIQLFLKSMLPNITNSDSSSEENDEFIDNISESTNSTMDSILPYSSTNSTMDSLSTHSSMPALVRIDSLSTHSSVIALEYDDDNDEYFNLDYEKEREEYLRELENDP